MTIPWAKTGELGSEEVFNRPGKFILEKSGYNPDAVLFSGLLGPVHNVKSHGAIGNGNSSDYIADTNGFISAFAASASDLWPIVVPAGIYYVDPIAANLSLGSGMKLNGLGRSIIKKYISGKLINMLGDGAEINRINFDGNGKTGNLVDVSGGTTQRIFGCRMEGNLTDPSLNYAADAGVNSSVSHTDIFPNVSGDIVIKCSGPDTFGIARRFSDMSLGGGKIELNSVNDLFLHNIFGRNLIMSVSGCLGVHAIGCKFGSLGAATVLHGINTIIVCCTIAGDVEIGANFQAGVYVANREVSLVDTSGYTNNVIVAANMIKNLGSSIDIGVGGYKINGIKVVGAQAAANPDTSGATLGQLETEVNELKAMLRTHGLIA